MAKNMKQVNALLDPEQLHKGMEIASVRTGKQWGTKTVDMLRDALTYYIEHAPKTKGDK